MSKNVDILTSRTHRSKSSRSRLLKNYGTSGAVLPDLRVRDRWSTRLWFTASSHKITLVKQFGIFGYGSDSQPGFCEGGTRGTRVVVCSYMIDNIGRQHLYRLKVAIALQRRFRFAHSQSEILISLWRNFSKYSIFWTISGLGRFARTKLMHSVVRQ